MTFSLVEVDVSLCYLRPRWGKTSVSIMNDLTSTVPGVVGFKVQWRIRTFQRVPQQLELER
jgi:hypothetical protein